MHWIHAVPVCTGSPPMDPAQAVTPRADTAQPRRMVHRSNRDRRRVHGFLSRLSVWFVLVLWLMTLEHKVRDERSSSELIARALKNHG